MSGKHMPWRHVTGPSLKGLYHTVESADGTMVCECYEGTDEERAGFARLIAAAPDLLEALESAEAVLALFLSCYGDPIADPAITKARAAIARAKRETQ